MTTPRIERIDTAAAPESTLAALHDLYLIWDAERVPNDPVVPWKQRLVDWRHLRSFEDIPRWVAWLGDQIVATSGVYQHRTQDLDNTWGWVFVHPEHRRQGLGRELVGHCIQYAAQSGRKRYATFVESGSVFEFWPKRLGLKPVYNERISQLRIADVDRSMMQTWTERAAERAGDYEIKFLESPIDPEFRERMVEVMEVMNTAPLEDMEEEPMHWTDEELRDVEEREAEKSRVMTTCVAIHKPTGRFAGYTTLVYQHLHPQMAHQWDTGVDPAHRNLGLGRWVKAAMLEKVIAEYPQVEVIETENAESNDPMLNINVAMGFKPSLEQVIYQGPIKAALKYVT